MNHLQSLLFDTRLTSEWLLQINSISFNACEKAQGRLRRSTKGETASARCSHLGGPHSSRDSPKHSSEVILTASELSLNPRSCNKHISQQTPIIIHHAHQPPISPSNNFTATSPTIPIPRPPHSQPILHPSPTPKIHPH